MSRVPITRRSMGHSSAVRGGVGGGSHRGRSSGPSSHDALVRPSSSRVRAAASFFQEVEQAPPDPILGVTEAFKKDSSPDKLNLGVGAYRTENLEPLVLDVVKKAEERIMSQNNNKEYLAVEGFAPFREVTARLLLGDDSKALKEKRVVTLQSLSGTGSLRIGAAFLAKQRETVQC